MVFGHRDRWLRRAAIALALLGIISVRPAEASERALRSSAETASRAIDAECNALIPTTKETSGRVFGANGGNRGTWHERDQSEGASRTRAGTDAVETARVWRKGKGAMAVQMTIRGESGDWAQTVDYCFRSDGTLARSEAVLVTVDVLDDEDQTNSAVRRMRRRYFERSGEEIEQRVQVWNVANGQPTKRRYADIQESIYRTAVDLPFASFLGSKR
jgi:hypothetical protein